MGLFDDMKRATRRTANQTGQIKSRCPHCKKLTSDHYPSEHSSRKVCGRCGKQK